MTLNELLNIYYKTGKIEDELIEKIDELNQEWKMIKDTRLGDVNYEVSNLGFIRNINTKQLLKPFYRKLYLAVKVCKDGKEHTESVHVFVAKAFVPGRTELKNEVDHINGMKECNNAKNLEWVTRSEQILRAYKLGLIKPILGENKSQSIYSNEFIINLCGYMELGMSLSELAIHMNVEKDKSFKYLVDGIRAKNRWTFISDNFNFPAMPNGKNVWVEPIVKEVCIRISKNIPEKYIFLYLNEIFPCRSKKCIDNFIKNLKNKKNFNEISDKYF